PLRGAAGGQDRAEAGERAGRRAARRLALEPAAPRRDAGAPPGAAAARAGRPAPPGAADRGAHRPPAARAQRATGDAASPRAMRRQPTPPIDGSGAPDAPPSDIL